VACEEALTRNPSSSFARGLLGTIALEAGKVVESERNLLEALRLAPNDLRVPVYCSTLAACRIVAADFRGAAEWAQKALHLNADYQPAIRNLVIANAALGDMERANMALARLRSLAPDYTLAKHRRVFSMIPRFAQISEHWLRAAGLPEE
jgi:Flp pilus assembly protein TadD